MIAALIRWSVENRVLVLIAAFIVAGVGVIGGDVAAHSELGAAVADHHLALADARRAGDRVGPLGVCRLH